VEGGREEGKEGKKEKYREGGREGKEGGREERKKERKIEKKGRKEKERKKEKGRKKERERKAHQSTRPGIDVRVRLLDPVMLKSYSTIFQFCKPLNTIFVCANWVEFLSFAISKVPINKQDIQIFPVQYL
jgi:hypothetical protein